MSGQHETPHGGPPQRDHPEAASHHQLLGVALNQLLMEKGIYSAEELRAMVERIESVGPETHGARVVARSWVDPGFAAALYSDAAAAVKTMGLESGVAELVALENSEALHNVVVCTLCSCYPWAGLGLPPGWYKSAPYRSRVVIDPRSVLEEFGVKLPDDTSLHVWDSTAEVRYLVLPMRPEGTENWTEQQLSEIVTRDSMIGTGIVTIDGVRS
jgi:nitrile hydratase